MLKLGRTSAKAGQLVIIFFHTFYHLTDVQKGVASARELQTVPPKVRERGRGHSGDRTSVFRFWRLS